MELRFQDRFDGGRVLAKRVAERIPLSDAVILALPSGGVPVGYALARALRLPMDVLLVHRLGLPGQAEVTMGAVTSGGTIVLNDDIVTPLEIPAETIAEVANREFAELKRRERLYRDGRPPLAISGQTALVVDDGLTTGTTMRAAVTAIRHAAPRRIVIAVPVASRAALGNLQADAVVCVMVPEVFHALGFWYRDFDPVSDDTVQRLLEEAGVPANRDETRPGASR